MFRRYIISIITKTNAPELTSDVLNDFGCSVSEPSNWLALGTTTARGLTFLDKAGKELNSALFKHQPYFNIEKDESITEKEEISSLIYDTLMEYYQLDATEVMVNIIDYDNR
jgi:hypothetical protein